MIQRSIPGRVAWYALLLVPLLVPTATSKLPFTMGAAATLNLFVVPKLFAMGLLVGIALVAWAIGAIQGSIELRSVPLYGWLVAFLGLATLSTIFGMHPATSFFGGRYHAAGLLVFLLGAALLFLVVQLVTTPSRIRALSWSVVAGGMVVAFIGLMQAVGLDPLGQFNPDYSYMTLRGGSLLGNPDFAGSYLVVPAVIALSLALSARDTALRVVGYGCFATILLAVLNSGARGAWVGAAIGLMALCVALVRSAGMLNRAALAAIGVALGVPLVWAMTKSSFLLARLSDLSQAETLGGGRFRIWSDAVRVIAAHPLLGTGPDAYRLGWYGARSASWIKAVGANVINEDPHNVLLLFAATIGIPAALAALGLVVGALVTSVGTAFQRDGGSNRLILSGWWAALLGLSAALFFTTNSAPMVMLIFTSLGVVLTVRAKPVEFALPLRYALATAAVVLAVAGIVSGSLYLAADALLAQAQTATDRAAVNEQAARIAPWYGEARYRAARARGFAAIAALGAKQADSPQQVLLAEESWDALVASNPREYQYRVDQANFLFNVGLTMGPDKLWQAVGAGRAAIEINPLSAKAAYFTALALGNLTEFEDAAATLEPVWEIDPTYMDPGTVYFRALVSSGDLDKAKVVLKKLQQRFPDDPTVASLPEMLKSPAKTP